MVAKTLIAPIPLGGNDYVPSFVLAEQLYGMVSAVPCCVDCVRDRREIIQYELHCGLLHLCEHYSGIHAMHVGESLVNVG